MNKPHGINGFQLTSKSRDHTGCLFVFVDFGPLYFFGVTLAPSRVTDRLLADLRGLQGLVCFAASTPLAARVMESAIPRIDPILLSTAVISAGIAVLTT
jgi:hypothetical protein